MTSTAVSTRTSAGLGVVRAGHEVAIERDPVSTPERLTQADALWPSRLRRIVRAGLRQWRQPDLVETAQLLTSELVTNALQHGKGPEIVFRLYLRDDQLVIEVRDGSPNLPALRRGGTDDESGRGLVLVDEMADAWGVSADGTTTWCSLSLRKGPDAPMDPVAPPTPLQRRYPTIAIPVDADVLSQAEKVARVGLRAISWHGDIDTAAEVLLRLVQNAIEHAVAPEADEKISVSLGITFAWQLIIDVTDPTPQFPNADEALRGELGSGLAEARKHATLEWFAVPDVDGKTVRATLEAEAVQQ